MANTDWQKHFQTTLDLRTEPMPPKERKRKFGLVPAGTVTHKVVTRCGKPQQYREVPVTYMYPIDNSRYTANKLREIRADGKHR